MFSLSWQGLEFDHEIESLNGQSCSKQEAPSSVQTPRPLRLIANNSLLFLFRKGNSNRQNCDDYLFYPVSLTHLLRLLLLHESFSLLRSYMVNTRFRHVRGSSPIPERSMSKVLKCEQRSSHDGSHARRLQCNSCFGSAKCQSMS